MEWIRGRCYPRMIAPEDTTVADGFDLRKVWSLVPLMGQRLQPKVDMTGKGSCSGR